MLLVSCHLYTFGQQNWITLILPYCRKYKSIDVTLAGVYQRGRRRGRQQEWLERGAVASLPVSAGSRGPEHCRLPGGERDEWSGVPEEETRCTILPILFTYYTCTAMYSSDSWKNNIRRISKSIISKTAVNSTILFHCTQFFDSSLEKRFGKAVEWFQYCPCFFYYSESRI